MKRRGQETLVCIWSTLGLMTFCCCSAKQQELKVSPFEYREIHLPGYASNETKELGLSNMDECWGLWGHSLHKILPEEPANTIYAEVDGQRTSEQYCFSSDKLFDYIAHYIDDQWGPEGNIHFAILPLDNTIACQCEKCHLQGNTDKDASPAVFSMVSKLAKRYPHQKFFTSYYQTTSSLPLQPFPENVGVLVSAIDFPLCTVRTPKEEVFCQLLSDWTKATSHVYVWDYICNFDDYFTPFPVFSIMQHRLQLYAQAGVKGIFLNGSGDDYSTLSRLKIHVLSAMMDNPDCDWKQTVKDVCHRLYPTTGDAVAQFVIEQEGYVAQKALPLPLYGGISEALKTYLPETAFMDFHNQLQQLLPQSQKQEFNEVNTICKAMMLTRLELKRHNANISDIDMMLKELELLMSEGINTYSEAGWTISDYVKDYAFMSAHANEMKGKNLLLGKKLTPKTELDEDYTDTSVLTDGLLGLPSCYHCGQMLWSCGKELKLIIPGIEGASRIRICATKNAAFRVAIPLEVILSDDTGEIERARFALPEEGSRLHAFAELKLPKQYSGNIILTIVRDTSERIMAVDEIEEYK